MKYNFQRLLDKLLKDKNVLYIVFFLSIVNLFGYIMASHFDAIIFFVIVGFLTTYFSKNMIIVLLISMITTNLFVMFRRVSYREGMKNKNNNGKENNNEEENNVNNTDEKNSNENDNNKNENHKKVNQENVNENENENENINDNNNTIEENYSNIDDLLNSGALQHMSKDTKQLAERQAKLMSQLENMQPMIEKAGKLMENMNPDKLEGMIGGITNLMSKFTGGK